MRIWRPFVPHALSRTIRHCELARGPTRAHPRPANHAEATTDSPIGARPRGARRGLRPSAGRFSTPPVTRSVRSRPGCGRQRCGRCVRYRRASRHGGSLQYPDGVRRQVRAHRSSVGRIQCPCPRHGMVRATADLEIRRSRARGPEARAAPGGGGRSARVGISRSPARRPGEAEVHPRLHRLPHVRRSHRPARWRRPHPGRLGGSRDPHARQCRPRLEFPRDLHRSRPGTNRGLPHRRGPTRRDAAHRCAAGGGRSWSGCADHGIRHTGVDGPAPRSGGDRGWPGRDHRHVHAPDVSARSGERRVPHDPDSGCECQPARHRDR